MRPEPPSIKNVGYNWPFVKSSRSPRGSKGNRARRSSSCRWNISLRPEAYASGQRGARCTARPGAATTFPPRRPKSTQRPPIAGRWPSCGLGEPVRMGVSPRITLHARRRVLSGAVDPPPEREQPQANAHEAQAADPSHAVVHRSTRSMAASSGSAALPAGAMPPGTTPACASRLVRCPLCPLRRRVGATPATRPRASIASPRRLQHHDGRQEHSDAKSFVGRYDLWVHVCSHPCRTAFPGRQPLCRTAFPDRRGLRDGAILHPTLVGLERPTCGIPSQLHQAPCRQDQQADCTPSQQESDNILAVTSEEALPARGRNQPGRSSSSKSWPRSAASGLGWPAGTPSWSVERLMLSKNRVICRLGPVA